jgi:RNA-directed DNA polymerase
MSLCDNDYTYKDTISLENLLLAWQEFIKGKKNRKDVQEFQRNLMQNIISLHNDLKGMTYAHSSYEAFTISDPKPRNIHKASVRDRLVHHAIYRKLYSLFNKKFIHNSYSCRLGKGTHRAIRQFQKYANKVSGNHTKTAWILKCDIRKFFASIDQDILMTILDREIKDKDILWLLEVIIKSFYSTEIGKGLPLGNLTSQLLVNIYMNEFDLYVKHKIRAKYYVRYADDFVVIDSDKDRLVGILAIFHKYLNEKLKLTLHPDKIHIKTIASGVDFLGWVHFSDHRVIRTSTKNRMFRNLNNPTRFSKESLASYIGLLKNGNTWRLQVKVMAVCEGEFKRCFI